jgi:DNA-binding NarL/FixJ family response regulator
MRGRELIKLLIADDSSLLRGYLTDTVHRFEEIRIVGQAEDVPQVVESVAKLKPDVVILDIQMPGGSGIDVLETIKKNNPSPIVIMFTNYPYPQYRKKCLAAGADFFFDKSLEFDALADTLKNLIVYLGCGQRRSEA